jgi:hypothetical protein
MLDKRIITYIEHYLDGKEKRKIKLGFDFAGMEELFRPIGGQSKPDVFNKEEK